MASPSLSFQQNDSSVLSLNLNKLSAPVYETEGYARKQQLSRCLQEITPVIDNMLFVSGREISCNRDVLLASGITHIVNAAADRCSNMFEREFSYLPLYLYDGPDEDALMHSSMLSRSKSNSRRAC